MVLSLCRPSPHRNSKGPKYTVTGCVCVYIYISIYTYVHIHIHIRMDINTITYIHVHIDICMVERLAGHVICIWYLDPWGQATVLRPSKGFPQPRTPNPWAEPTELLISHERYPYICIYIYI